MQDPQARTRPTAHISKHMLDEDGTRDFTAEVPGDPAGRRHHPPAPICTYPRTGEGWLYPATVIDL